MMERDGFKFDLETQRFLTGRWETETGEKVRVEIIEGIRNNVEIRGILDAYVLDHPDNFDPYAFPIYPKSEMGKGRFWVLTNDDLRGIHIYNEDLSGSQSLEKKALTYASFYNCDLSDTNMEMADFSYARFEVCNMARVIFAASGGFNVRLLDCDLKAACLWASGFRDSDFSGSEFSGAYFEGTLLENAKVNHRSRFDRKLTIKWATRTMPDQQQPDILRALRLAYEKAELWSQMDEFLYAEKRARRKFIEWPRFVREKNFATLFPWLGSGFLGLTTGYATKPSRVIALALVTAVFFASLYFCLGTPSVQSAATAGILESLYFSFTTFATLGYGDLSYGADRPGMRLLSVSEAWIGAVFISVFVVLLARKAFR